MSEKNKLVVAKMGYDESILSICIDADTDSWVKLKYNGEVIPEDKTIFQKGAIVFWDELRVNDLPITKYNKCPALRFKFKNGMIELKDGILTCENIVPRTYEMFYYVAEEYRKRIKS